MEAKQELLVEREAGFALITLNRPEVLNALSPEVLSQLSDTMETLAVEEDIRVVMITGAGRAFAAGADIQALVQAGAKEIQAMDTRRSWQRIWQAPVATIAVVNAYAYGGGCELALGCDLIIASERARLAQPEIKLGIMPGAGGTQRLAKALGPYRAMEMVLTGKPISATQAYAYGLVNRLVPHERLLDEAFELARKIASRPPIALRLAREALRYGVEHTLAAGLEIERRNLALLFETADQEEGMSAFLEKRSARFTGR